MIKWKCLTLCDQGSNMFILPDHLIKLHEIEENDSKELIDY